MVSYKRRGGIICNGWVTMICIGGNQTSRRGGMRGREYSSLLMAEGSSRGKGENVNFAYF